jgi:hypothetical protein
MNGNDKFISPILYYSIHDANLAGLDVVFIIILF